MSENPTYTPFSQLSDQDLAEAMIMHIRMGYILVHPGKGEEGDRVARDMVSKLTIDQLNEIHPHTFFANKKIGTVPANPYLVAKEMLKE